MWELRTLYVHDYKLHDYKLLYNLAAAQYRTSLAASYSCHIILCTSTEVKIMTSQEKARPSEAMSHSEKEALIQFQANSSSNQQQPLYDLITGPGLASGPVTTVRPSLPRSLWPHNFLYFSVGLLIILGLLNPLTFITTIPAVVLAGFVSDLNVETKVL